MKRFGTLSGIAAPVAKVSRLQAGDKRSGGRDFRVRFQRGAFEGVARCQLLYAIQIPIWVNHQQCVVGHVVAMRETLEGLHFTADVHDDERGRLLPQICFTHACPIDAAGVSFALPCSIGVDGDYLETQTHGDLVRRYWEVTRVREISILTWESEGLFDQARMSFQLEQSGDPDVDSLRNWTHSRSDDDGLLPPGWGSKGG